MRLLKNPGFYLVTVFVIVFFLGTHESGMNLAFKEFDLLCKNVSPNVFQLSYEEAIPLLNKDQVIKPSFNKLDVTGFVTVFSDPSGQTVLNEQESSFYLFENPDCVYQLVVSKDFNKAVWVEK